MSMHKIAEVHGGAIRLEGDKDSFPVSAEWRTVHYRGKKTNDPGYLVRDEAGNIEGWMSTPDYNELPEAPIVEAPPDPVDPTPARTGDSPASDPPPVEWPAADPDQSQR